MTQIKLLKPFMAQPAGSVFKAGKAEADILIRLGTAEPLDAPKAVVSDELIPVEPATYEPVQRKRRK